MDGRKTPDLEVLPAFQLELEGWTDFENDRSDELIKWIKAPSRGIVERFVQIQGLRAVFGVEDLPIEFSALGHSHGIDIVLDESGRVISGELGITELP